MMAHVVCTLERRLLKFNTIRNVFESSVGFSQVRNRTVTTRIPTCPAMIGPGRPGHSLSVGSVSVSKESIRIYFTWPKRFVKKLQNYFL